MTPEGSPYNTLDDLDAVGVVICSASRLELYGLQV